MKVSIIIPTLNEYETIGKLIDSLLKDPYPKKEIIIVDGGSVDGTLEVARSKDAIVLMERGKKCPANARNMGSKYSNAEVLCFLDGDTEQVNNKFISCAMEHFKNPQVVGVCVNSSAIEGTLVEQSIERLWSSKISKYMRRKEVKARGLHFVRKEVFEAVNGFPLLGFGEDRLFRKKLKKFLQKHPDLRIEYEPNAMFLKHHPRSFRELFKASVWYGRTIFPYFNKAGFNTWTLFSMIALLTYPLCFLSIPLLTLSPLFLFPIIFYLSRFIFLCFDRSCLMIPFVDLVRAAGFMIGLFEYLVGKKSLSRG